MSGSRFPTMSDLWIAAALSAILIIALMKPAPPNDLWWQLAMGREVVRTGAVPTVDTFSFTRAGQPFYDQPWLAQILMYGLFQAGGIALLRMAHALLVFVAYALVLETCRVRTGRMRAAALLLILTIPVSAESWIPRSENFGLPLLAAFFYVLTRWRLAWREEGVRDEPGSQGARIVGLSRPKPTARPGLLLWPLPFLMLLWVNLHGSFVLGGVLVVLFGLGSIIDLWIDGRRAGRGAADLAASTRRVFSPLLWWGLATAAAVLLNPRGAQVLRYVFGMASDPLVTRWITEWAPPTPRTLAGAFFFLYAGIVAGAAVVGRGRRDVADLLVVAAFLTLALGAMRHVVWFPIVSLPFLTSRVTALSPVRSRRAPQPRGARVANALILFLLACAVVPTLPWLRPYPASVRISGSLLTSNTPVAAVEALRQDPAPPKRLFHSIGTGSYLMWAAPGHPVFVDARIELYPLSQWEAYGMLNRGEAVDSLVDAYRLDGMLLDADQGALLEKVLGDPRWEMRYQDEESTYLVREAGPSRPLSPSESPAPGSP